MKFDYVLKLLGGIYKSTDSMSPFDSLRGIKSRTEYLEPQRFLRRRTEDTQFHQADASSAEKLKSSDERIAMDFHYYEPSKGHGLRHNPFNAIIAPRPIGWISSLNANGQANLAPYSFFNAFLYDPAIIGFSSISWKYNVKNLAETR